MADRHAISIIQVRLNNYQETGDASLAAQTFSIYDAMTTGFDYYATLPNRAASSVEVVYPAASGVYPWNDAIFYYQPLNDNVYVPEPTQGTPRPWRDWDAIIHEYGHHIEDVNGFLGTTGGAHEPGHNLRFDDGVDTLQLADIQLAFAEGWANYFSVRAQRDERAEQLGIPGVGDDKLGSNSLETGAGGSSSWGEDDELSVARILWDLVDMENDAEDHDRVAAGDQFIWNTIPNDEMINADKLWDLLTATAPVSQKIDYGAIFMANNVSPTPTVAEILPGNTNVKFYFEIPHGKNAAGQQLARPLLQNFKIRVFDGTLTEIWSSPALEVDGDAVPIPGSANGWNVNINQSSKFITGMYTTTPAEWQAIAANPGAKRWIVEGIDDAYFPTGPYWSDSLEFYVGPTTGGFGSMYYTPTTVTVFGTDSADKLSITQSGVGPNDTISILINGAPVVIPLAQVSRLRIFALGGNDTVNGSQIETVPLEIYGGLGDDELYGGAANDEISGHSGNDLIDGRGGADLLYGDDDNDTLIGDTGNDTLSGGAGNDTYIFDPDFPGGADAILGLDDPGVDTLDFSGAMTAVAVNLSVTVPQVVAGANLTLLLQSATAIENVLGGDKNDTITGNGANNKLVGNSGNDTIDGGSGDDFLEGGPGDDQLRGGQGNDTYRFLVIPNNFLSFDTILGPDDPGVDQLDFSGSLDAVNVDLALTTWQNVAPGILKLRLPSSTAIENVLGGTGNDVLLGNSADNLIIGNEGNDTIDGRGGMDSLEGRDGNDKIYGGAGVERN